MAVSMPRKPPKFKSEAEESAFWDSHDSTDIASELTDDVETIFVRPEVGVIEINKETWRQLARIAKRGRTTPARLVRRWLREKLSSSATR